MGERTGLEQAACPSNSFISSQQIPSPPQAFLKGSAHKIEIKTPISPYQTALFPENALEIYVNQMKSYV